MYNSDMPNPAALPSAGQLLRSTAIAAVAAAALLVTVVLPAEYAIDPTGAGKVLGLTAMGEIKTQLAREAEDDRRKDAEQPTPSPAIDPKQRSGLMQQIFALVSIGQAQAQAAASQETVVTLAPGEGAEVKMAMKAGARVNYTWSASAGAVNYDMHGAAPGGKESSYKRDRGASSDAGVLTAGYEGYHGWFWRNRGQSPVTLTLKLSGDFTDLKRMK